MLFAEDIVLPTGFWAACAGIVTAVGGLIVAAMRQRAKERLVEIAAAKADMQSLYKKWKEIAEVFRDEKDIVRKQYEEKCVECIRLQIHLEECRMKEAKNDKGSG